MSLGASASRRLSWPERVYPRAQRGLARMGLRVAVDRVMRTRRPPGPGSAWDAGGIRFLECSPADAAWLAAWDPARHPVFAWRFAQGWRCYAAAGGEGRCQAYVWAGTGSAVSADGRFRWRVPRGGALITDTWAHPLAFGAYPDLCAHVVRRLWSEGLCTRWGHVEYGNRLSLRVHRALGAEAAGWLVRLDCRLGGVYARFDGGVRLGWARTPVPLAPLTEETAELGGVGGVAGEHAA